MKLLFCHCKLYIYSKNTTSYLYCQLAHPKHNLNMNSTDLIGLLAGICVTVSVIPQIYKVWKTKKVKAISLVTFSMLTVGIAIWVVYGVLKDDLPIIVTNSVSLCLNLIMIYFIVYYEKEN